MKKAWIKFLSILGLTTIKAYNSVVKDMSETIIKLSFMLLETAAGELKALIREAEIDEAKKDAPDKQKFTATATSNVKAKDKPVAKKEPERKAKAVKPKKSAGVDSKKPSSL